MEAVKAGLGVNIDQGLRKLLAKKAKGWNKMLGEENDWRNNPDTRGDMVDFSGYKKRIKLLETNAKSSSKKYLSFLQNVQDILEKEWGILCNLCYGKNPEDHISRKPVQTRHILGPITKAEMLAAKREIAYKAGPGKVRRPTTCVVVYVHLIFTIHLPWRQDLTMEVKIYPSMREETKTVIEFDRGLDHPKKVLRTFKEFVKEFEKFLKEG